MREFIETILNDYIIAKMQPFAGHLMGTYFRHEIPNAIYNTGIVNARTHLIDGSAGKGNWATIPWIGIFDKRITNTAQKGIYIVYLLASDGNTLYLTFNQGSTVLKKHHGKQEAIKRMRQNASKIISQIDSRGFETNIEFTLGDGESAELYQKGTIFYKAYRKGAVPTEEELKADLSKMMDIYREYAKVDGEIHQEEDAIGKNLDFPRTYDSSFEKKRIIPESTYGIDKDLDFRLTYPSAFDKNRIIFGAPGTGKSYRLKKEAEAIFGDNIERVTFHPDYAYSHFMGCYKPQTTPEGGVRYGFIPGPFLRVLVKALRSGMEGEATPHLLLIEEINRARVAAVFGDAFQLLDRVDDEFSEYDIAVSEDVKAYLSEELGCSPDECARIRIPGNMFIWATMNSADQGVFPMDTAFKRRWTFEYLPIDPEDAPDVLIPMNTNGETGYVSWNALRGAINDRLSAMRINEDKLIGPYFLKPSVLEGDENGRVKNLAAFKKSFKNKILMYLFEDAARQRRQELFKGCADCHRYSSLCNEFDKNGLGIFGDDLIKQA